MAATSSIFCHRGGSILFLTYQPVHESTTISLSARWGKYTFPTISPTTHKRIGSRYHPFAGQREFINNFFHYWIQISSQFIRGHTIPSFIFKSGTRVFSNDDCQYIMEFCNVIQFFMFCCRIQRQFSVSILFVMMLFYLY